MWCGVVWCGGALGLECGSVGSVAVGAGSLPSFFHFMTLDEKVLLLIKKSASDIPL